MTASAELIHFPEPRDVETEQAVLGCMLIDNTVIEPIAAFLKWEHFSEPLHQVLFDGIVQLRAAGREVSSLALKSAFATNAALIEMGGHDYLVNLMQMPPSTMPSSALSYARSVFDLAKRRQITTIGKDLAGAAVDLALDSSPSALIEQASAALLDLDIKAAMQSTVSGGAAASAALAKAWAAAQSERTPGLSLGLEEIDKAIGGAHAGDMIVVAGRPGMGKSALACGMGRNVAAAGGGVLYISCEMTQEQLGRRLISDTVRDAGHSVPYQSLRAGRIDRAMYELCADAEQWIKTIPFEIDDRRKPPLPQIIASAKRAARRFEAEGRELRLIIVDHMQLVAAPQAYKGNRVSEVTEVSGELKALARDIGAPIIACSQLNRDLEGRDVKDKRPTLRDLRESGAIEQDADIVMLLYREEYYHLVKRPDKFSQPAAYELWEPGYAACKNELDVIIAKNREGEPTTVKLHCHMAVSAIRTWRGHA